MKRIKILLGMIFLLSSMSFAESAFQFNVMGKQIPASQDVNGLRLNLFYGKTTNVSGLDINILSLGETDNFKGLQLEFLGANKVNKSFSGVGFGIANIHKGTSKGVLWGLVNVSNQVEGLQIGGVNYSSGRSTVDIGLVNVSQGAAFQMGLVNVTNDLTGVQLGLINMAKTGFLPIFPFFNIDGRLF